MKISPRFTALSLTAAALLAISACGGSDAPANSEVKTPKTKNAALSFTTLPATTAPKVTIAASGPTTVVRATTTSIARTVTTPMPKLPVR